MLVPVSSIIITPQPTLDEIKKGVTFDFLSLRFDFAESWNFSYNWSDLTNTGNIVLPKNVYVQTFKEIEGFHGTLARNISQAFLNASINSSSSTEQKLYPLYRQNKTATTPDGLLGGSIVNDDNYVLSQSEKFAQSKPSDNIKKYDLKEAIDNINNRVNPTGVDRGLIKRGYRIQIQHGYSITREFIVPDFITNFDGSISSTRHAGKIRLRESASLSTINGFVTSVAAEFNISLEFSDAMFILKQFGMENVTNKVKSGDKNPLKTLIQNSLDSINTAYGYIEGDKLTLNMLGTEITYDTYSLYVAYETVAQFLERLKKDFHLQIFFKGNELNVGYLISYNQKLDYKKNTKLFDDMYKPIFHFQDNIISSNLKYKLKDDIILTCISEGATISVPNGVDSEGKPKKPKKVKLTVYSAYDQSGVVTSHEVTKEKPAPIQTSGEKRTFFFPQARTIEELIILSEEELRKFHYDGYSGSFTTFGSPLVDFDTIIELKNAMLSEQDGFYRVKSVKYSGGIGGYRQEIELFYKFKINEE